MLKATTMKIEDFLDLKYLPDNPIQRDTVRRAAVYGRPGGHLSELHPTMLRVSMAQTPDGKKRWLLDGHTRRLLWSSEKMQVPTKLYMDIFEVQNEQQAMEYYLNFDSPLAHETGQDRVFGALKFLKFLPTHRYLFKATGLQRATDYLIFPKKWGDMKHLSMVQKMKPWIPTFRIMDSMESFYNSQAFPSPFMAAFLMAVRRDGNSALEFIQLYHDDMGTRHQKTMDGVHLAREVFRNWRDPITIDMYKQNRRAAFNSITPQVLQCYEMWMDGKRFPIKVGRGGSHWTGIPTPREWWLDNIGELDHPGVHELDEDDE